MVVRRVGLLSKATSTFRLILLLDRVGNCVFLPVIYPYFDH